MLCRDRRIGQLGGFVACVLACVSGLAAQSNAIVGVEFASAVNLVSSNVRIEGRLFVPDRAPRVRAVIVITNYARLDRGPEPYLLFDPQWRTLSEACACALVSAKLGTIRPIDPATPPARHFARNAAMGGADALLRLLQRLGDESAHPELASAPLLFFGVSAAAGFGTTFAELYPDRVIAFIRYHTHRRGVAANVRDLSKIPALIVAGGKDETAGIEDAEALWHAGRAFGAPWTFVVDPNASHGEEKTLWQTGTALMIPWIAAVIEQRVPRVGVGLTPIANDSGWLGTNHTAEAVPRSAFRGEVAAASWLPDRSAALGWQAVVGAPKQ